VYSKLHHKVHIPHISSGIFSLVHNELNLYITQMPKSHQMKMNSPYRLASSSVH